MSEKDMVQQLSSYCSETKVLKCGRYLQGGFYIKPYLIVHYNKWHLQLCYDMYMLVYNSDYIDFYMV